MSASGTPGTWPGPWPDPAIDAASGALDGLRVLVVGAGRSGLAAARALLAQGAVVTVSATEDPAVSAAAAAAESGLAALGARTAFGPRSPAVPPPGTQLLVTSPGVPPRAPLLAAAAAAGTPVWGEVELAWRLRPLRAAGGGPAPWLGVTGTNGKTTTTQLLERMLAAAGRRVVAAGNVGTPLVEVVTAPDAPELDVLAVELSSFQLHGTTTLALDAAVVLNLAADHLDWHAGPDAYAAAKARVYDRVRVAAVHNADDPATAALLARAAPGPAAVVVATTLGVPAAGQLGLVDDLLVDRAFSHRGHGDVPGEGTVLASLADLAGLAGPADPADPAGPADPPGPADTDGHPGGPPPHLVADALAAAALARSAGVPATAVAAGLRGSVLGPHRMATVAVHDGVRWVDDSKATNPHAAAASLAGSATVVWIAGGLAKGASYEDLVRSVRGRLRGVVLLGRDRGLVADALARHAPWIPVRDTGAAETGAMTRVVAAAAELARPGDTVLLAPAAASHDQFTDYAHRGNAFAAEVRARVGRRGAATTADAPAGSR